jgi:hypothetical protein
MEGVSMSRASEVYAEHRRSLRPIKARSACGDLLVIMDISKYTTLWEYEDQLEKDITTGMYNASIVDVVRVYPYVLDRGIKYYVER